MNHNVICAVFCVLSLLPIANAIAFGWGKNDQGQLGMGTNVPVYKPTPVPFYSNINLFDCKTATNYIICFAQNGSAYGSGLQFYGQFATGTAGQTAVLTPVACPKLNSSLAISLGGMACNANMKTNLLGWGNLAGYVQGKTSGTSPTIQTLLPSYKFDGKVISVSSVMEGTIVTLSNQTVWVAGSNSNYSLGFGGSAFYYNFIENTFWRGWPPTFFSSQSQFGCALAANGSLYCWGQNSNGQLCLGDTTNRNVPTLVTFFPRNQLQPYRVVYGVSHTVILTCGGKVFTCGSNANGQLGTSGSSGSTNLVPTEVVDLRWQGSAADIFAGSAQTFVRTNDNKWFVWGANSQGTLGLGTSADVYSSTQNSFLTGNTTIKSSSQSANFFAWVDTTVNNNNTKPGCYLTNECAGINNCTAVASCVDKEIGYACQCPLGYTGDGYITGSGCTNPNSCSKTGAKCDSLALCDDSTGSAICYCQIGYQGDGVDNVTVNGTPFTGSGCSDINECLDYPCADNAYCTNTVPSYNCTCNQYYIGDAYISGCTKQCQPGEYSKGLNDCESCSPGTYSDTVQASYCLPCPIGTYADSYGTNSVDACIKCPVGGYSTYGASYCGLCDYGYTNDNSTNNQDNSTCFGCPLGTYGYYGECYPCGQGQYSITPVAKQCLSCAPGYYSTDQEALGCVKCPAGYISKGDATSCIMCGAGLYSAAGSKECLKCPPGTSTNGNSGQASCTPCAPGYFSGKAASTTCSTCAKGTYTSSNSSTVCTRCPQGSFSGVAGSTSCTPCTGGTFVASTAGTQCFNCTPGNSASDGVNCIPCNAGTYWDSSSSNCLPCPPGQFVATTGATSCFSCAAGYYAPSSGALACIRCPINTFAASTGASTCTACSSGTKSGGAASACVSAC